MRQPAARRAASVRLLFGSGLVAVGGFFGYFNGLERQPFADAKKWPKRLTLQENHSTGTVQVFPGRCPRSKFARVGCEPLILLCFL